MLMHHHNVWGKLSGGKAFVFDAADGTMKTSEVEGKRRVNHFLNRRDASAATAIQRRVRSRQLVRAPPAGWGGLGGLGSSPLFEHIRSMLGGNTPRLSFSRQRSTDERAAGEQTSSARSDGARSGDASEPPGDAPGSPAGSEAGEEKEADSAAEERAAPRPVLTPASSGRRGATVAMV